MVVMDMNVKMANLSTFAVGKFLKIVSCFKNISTVFKFKFTQMTSKFVIQLARKRPFIKFVVFILLFDICRITKCAIPFVLKLVFEHCIKAKIISEDELIKRIQYHDYGLLNRSNIPSKIDLHKHNLGQNASQNMCLFKTLVSFCLIT